MFQEVEKGIYGWELLGLKFYYASTKSIKFQTFVLVKYWMKVLELRVQSTNIVNRGVFATYHSISPDDVITPHVIHEGIEASDTQQI